MTANLSAPCFNACFSNQPAFLTRTPGGARDGARLGQKVTPSARRSLPAPISGRIAAITAADRDKWGRRYQRNNGVWGFFCFFFLRGGEKNFREEEKKKKKTIELFISR